MVLETLACVLLFGAGSLVLARYLAAMATTSLWTDELHTIIHYSSRGPIATLTEYDEPNNHIFFNLVNSLTPGRSSVAPLRARIWSFAAFLLTLGMGIGFFARRRSLVFGALLFCLLGVQAELLDLMLQARGYSFLALFSLLAVFLTFRLFDGVKRRDLVFLGLVSVAGAWTVPTFALFVAPLWLLVFAALRRRDVFVAGAFTGLAILAVYAPVARQLAYQLQHYDERWGRQYGNIRAVGGTLKTYLLHPSVVGLSFESHGVMLAISLGACAMAFALWRSFREALPVLVTLGAVAAFFSVCLALQTPLIRSTAFIVVPLAFSAMYLLRLLAREASVVRGAGALLLAGFLALHAQRSARAFQFLPLEQWQEMGRVLHDTFPEHTKFFVSISADFLAGYLFPGYAAADQVDVPAVARGEELYLDTPVVDPPDGRIDAGKSVKDAVEYRIPQRRAGYEALWLCPPEHAFIRAARSPRRDERIALTDRNVDTGTDANVRIDGLELELEPGHLFRSVVIVSAPESEAVFFVHALDANGKTLVLGPIRHSRNVALVNLRDQPVAIVSLEATDRSRGVPPVREVWAYPVR